jgi:hypothetical protein
MSTNFSNKITVLFYYPMIFSSINSTISNVLLKISVPDHLWFLSWYTSNMTSFLKNIMWLRNSSNALYRRLIKIIRALNYFGFYKNKLFCFSCYENKIIKFVSKMHMPKNAFKEKQLLFI